VLNEDDIAKKHINIESIPPMYQTIIDILHEYQEYHNQTSFQINKILIYQAYDVAIHLHQDIQ
jgi:GTP1/Obg family GTP-binding protein